MTIGINTSLAGLNAATKTLNTSASNIVNQDTRPEVNVTEGLVTLKTAQISYNANAEMLSKQIELSATLLDILDDD